MMAVDLVYVRASRHDRVVTSVTNALIDLGFASADDLSYSSVSPPPLRPALLELPCRG